MIDIWNKKYVLNFKFAAGTSRGILHRKISWFIFIKNKDENRIGIGEAGLLKGLSIDDKPEFETKLEEVCKQVNKGVLPVSFQLDHWPSIQFGLEMAWRDLEYKGSRILFPTKFTRGEIGIPINGLVWMGNFDFMKKQVKEKINAGFTCIKLKIGAIDFEKELDLIRLIRQEFTPTDIEIRVDANGAFTPDEALEKLKLLSEFQLHSIEQPIRQGQWETMASLCEKTPLPIALDEELIGVLSKDEKQKMLSVIKPQYIILKPGLLGGFAASEEWIGLAAKQNTGWWVTSALESNIGLNAIAQWTFTLNNSVPQGLGTGQLYTNNFDSPLTIENGKLFHRSENKWDLAKLRF